MKHPIAHSRNNILVYVDLIDSLAAKRIAQQPQLLGFAKEILQNHDLLSAEPTLEYDMGRIVGFNPIVPTGSNDTVFYARTLKDTVYTRFVKINKPQPTQIITVRLRRMDDGTYELFDFWLGHAYPPRPGENNETSESKTYWANNAVMFDNQLLQASSITKTCPY